MVADQVQKPLHGRNKEEKLLWWIGWEMQWKCDKGSFLNCGKCPFWEGWMWRGIQREEKCQDILPFFSINVNDTVLSHTGPSSGLMPSFAGIWLLTALTWQSLSQNHLRPEKAASSRAACIQWLVDFILGGSKITADSDCSHEIKRLLLLGRKPMTNLESTLKSRDITLLTKVYLVKAMISPVVM